MVQSQSYQWARLLACALLIPLLHGALQARVVCMSKTEDTLITTWCCRIIKKSNCPEKACLHSILLCHGGGVCSPKGRIAYAHEHLWFPSVICISHYPYLWLLVWWWLKFRWKWVYVKRMFFLMCPCVRAKALTVIEMKWYQVQISITVKMVLRVFLKKITIIIFSL